MRTKIGPARAIKLKEDDLASQERRAETLSDIAPALDRAASPVQAMNRDRYRESGGVTRSEDVMNGLRRISIAV